MNKGILFLGMAALAFAGCSSDDLADSVNPGGNTSADETQVPVTFNTHRGNVTRANEPSGTGNGLENYSFNFGVYAYKYTTTNSQPIMGNYLVGYSQAPSTDEATDAKGYDHSSSSTWAKDAGTNADHKSPWFYAGLGKDEYKYAGTAGYYTTSDADKMSANSTQPLVYWDHAYTSTEFDAYAPYDNGASFDYSTKVLTLSATASANPTKVLYTKATVNSSADQDVNLTFKHADAQVRLAFRSNIPGYRVQVLGLGDGGATFTETATDDDKSSIVATPVTVGSTGNTLGSYNNGGIIKIDYSGDEPKVSYDGTNTTSALLHFTAPMGSVSAEINKLGGSKETVHVIPNNSDYDYTNAVQVVPTQGANPAFLIHVTFKIISEATGEETYVNNARVLIPADETNWANNTLNTYRFTITANASGSTDPTIVIDPAGVDPSGVGALVPIVFDGATIENYQDADEVNHDHNIND